MPLPGAARQSDFLNWSQRIVDAEPWRSLISSNSIPLNSSSGLLEQPLVQLEQAKGYFC